MRNLIYLALALLGMFASRARAETTYYDLPVINPPGIVGYYVEFNKSVWPTAADAVKEVLRINAAGTCGGGCYVTSVTWFPPAPGSGGAWGVRVYSPTYRVELGGGGVYPMYAAGFTPYVTEPPGAYPTTYTAYPYNPRKNLGPPCGLEACGNPIHVGTGNKFQQEADLPMVGMLEFTRYYNSYPYAPTHLLGKQWTHSYTRLLDYQGSKVVVTRPGGKQLEFVAGSGGWAPDADVAAKLRRIDGPTGTLLGWSYREQDDREIESYDASGRLTRVVRSDGQSIDLAYSGSQLSSVTAQDGRKLTFAYDSSQRISGLTDSNGQTFTYSYDAAGRLTSVVYPGGGSKSYLYNESAYTSGASLPTALTGIIDEKGQRFATYRYAADGRAVSTEHAGGVERFSLSYNADGSTTETTPTNLAQQRGFVISQGVKRSTLISETHGGVERKYLYTYDANGHPDVITHPSDPSGGISTDYDFDSRGLLTQRIDSANSPLTKRTVQTDWHPVYNLPTERRVLDANDLVVARQSWTYNSRGQVLTTSEIDPAGVAPQRTTTYAYCDQVDANPAPGACPLIGLLVSVDGPRTDLNDTTTFAYYPDNACPDTGLPCSHRRGDLWKVTNPLGQATTYLNYNDRGQPTELMDANGVHTSLEYSPRGWLVARKVRGTDDTTEVDDAVTRIDYELTGDVSKVTAPGGATMQFSYDAAHRITDATDALGNSVHYTLDNSGNRLEESSKDSAGVLRHKLSRVYNIFNQMTSLADASSAPIDFSYGMDGSLDTTTDRLLRVSDQDVDALGRVTQLTANRGGGASDRAVTGLRYDALDRITQVIDPKGLLTKYSYNGLGDQTLLESPDTGATSFGYDTAGNLAAATDARGRLTTYTYDALGRLTGQITPTTAQSVYFDYDSVDGYWPDGVPPPNGCNSGEVYGAGRLGGMRDESGATTFCYDRRGNPVRKTQSVLGGSKLTVGVSFDGADRVSAMTYPSGAIVSYLRNANGEIIAVDAVPSAGAAQVTLVSNASYLPFGPLTRWTLGTAGRVITKAYDANYDIDKVSDSSTSNPVGEDFSLDLGGRITDLVEQTAAAATSSRTFGYDGLDRVTLAKNGSKVTEAFTYDATGNRLGRTLGNKTTSYTYATDSHRLVAVGNTNRTYDSNGNTSTSGAGNAKQTFVYDDRNRLRDYKLGSVLKASYRYNGKGEQVLRVDSTTPVNSRQYVYDEAGHLLGEYTTTGLRIQEYVWLDDTLVGILSDHDGSGYQYVETDHLGTPRAVIHPTKNTIIWRWNLTDTVFGDHAPLGDPDGNGITYTLNLRYPGQRADPITGLNYNYFRDYDPATGRYIESDPTGLGAGPSTYAYAEGDPLRSIDENGLQTRPPRGTISTPGPGPLIGLARALIRSIQRYNPRFRYSLVGPPGGTSYNQRNIDDLARILQEYEASYRERNPNSCPAAGGVYLLRDPVTEMVMRTGRTIDFARRAGQHARDGRFVDYVFEPVYRTDNYSEQRGLEQLVHETYNPPFNYVRPISPTNRNRQSYLDAADNYLKERN